MPKGLMNIESIENLIEALSQDKRGLLNRDRTRDGRPTREKQAKKQLETPLRRGEAAGNVVAPNIHFEGTQLVAPSPFKTPPFRNPLRVEEESIGLVPLLVSSNQDRLGQQESEENRWRMKFGTALLFNANPEWFDKYVDYEALKKSIPKPTASTTYTDLESAPLLAPDAPGSSTNEFTRILNKELTKCSDHYQALEKEFLDKTHDLLDELANVENMDTDGMIEGSDYFGRYDDDEGYEAGDTLRSLPIRGRASRTLSERFRMPSATRGERSPSRDNADLTEAHHHQRLRTTSQTRSTALDDIDSSPETSPRIGTTSLTGAPATPAKRRRSLHLVQGKASTFGGRPRGASIGTSSSGPDHFYNGTMEGILDLLPTPVLSFFSQGTTHLPPPLKANDETLVWHGSSEKARSIKILYKRKISEVWMSWDSLAGFRDLNRRAVEKGLKKFDKITGQETQGHFLREKLTEFYPWLATSIDALDGNLALLTFTYARVATLGDWELAQTQLRSQLREKVVIERDTVWRQMVHEHRNNEGGFITTALDAPRLSEYFPEKKPKIWTPCGSVALPKWIGFKGITFVCALGIMFGLMNVKVAHMPFEHVEERNCFALLVFCTILWATEAIPLFVTSLSVPFLVVVLRVLRSADTTERRLTAAEGTKFIFSQMFSPTIMLLIGGFTIAAALSKTRIDVIMATRVLKLAGTRPSMVLLSQMCVATFASMWISNVAAPTLCFALIKPILEKLPPGTPFIRCLILSIALASNIGGMASPISSPQNLIALGAMEPPLDWLQWFAISLPVATCSILLIWAWLHVGYRWDRSLSIAPMRVSTDKFEFTHWYVTIVTLGTIALWCLEKKLEPFIGDMGIIAIIPLVAFFGTGILSKEDFHNFHWSIVFLAMGGIALGKAVLSSGLLDDLDSVIESLLEGMGLWQILFWFSWGALIISTFISHTIAAVLLVPIASRIGESLEDPHPTLLIMATALICSAGMGLPVSGFPNMTAIALESPLGKRYLDPSDFLKNGIIASILATVVIFTLGFVLMKVLAL